MAKPNYRHQKKQREQQRLARQAEKLQRRTTKPEAADGTAGVEPQLEPGSKPSP